MEAFLQLLGVYSCFCHPDPAVSIDFSHGAKDIPELLRTGMPMQLPL